MCNSKERSKAKMTTKDNDVTVNPLSTNRGCQPGDNSDEAEQALSQPLIATQEIPSNQEAAAKADKQQSSEDEFDDGGNSLDQAHQVSSINAKRQL